MAMAGVETKAQLVYMVGSALILHHLVIWHIPTSWTDLLGIVSPSILKWDAIFQHKRSVQGASFGAKQVIVELIPTAEE